MPSASFLFFRFRKITQEIFSELHRTKTQPPIFPTCTWSPKGRRRGATTPPHHVVARPHLWSREDMVWGPRAALTIVIRPIYSPQRENPKTIDNLTWKVPSRCHHRNLVSRVRRFCSGTLSGRGLTLGASSTDHTDSTLTPCWLVSSLPMDYMF